MENTYLWDALGKTDPTHTKQFSRAGGFKGTALKPQWAIKKLTEQFGPCGIGWGMEKPEFQVVNGIDEVLVYCTLQAWHGRRDQILFGVGGDKVVGKNKNGLFTDDEAFKKAFTDALMNAFKFVGVGADIHMGQFDDSKYVDDIREEFQQAEKKANSITPAQEIELQDLARDVGADEKKFLAWANVAAWSEIPAKDFGAAKKALEAKRKAKPKADPQYSNDLNDTIPEFAGAK